MLFEITNVVERKTVFGLSSAVNRLAKIVIFMEEPQTDGGSAFGAFAKPVTLPVTTDGIKTLQRESRWINLAVTNIAGFDRLMLL